MSKKITKETLFTLIEKSPIDVFLFGSALSSPTPNDIDLLVVYNESKAKAKEINTIREAIAKHIHSIMGLYADLVVLSRTEERGVEFCTTESCTRLTRALFENLAGNLSANEDSSQPSDLLS